MIRTSCAVVALGLSLAMPAAAGWKGPTTYRGTPDLPVTGELVAAGGGAQHFDSKKLVGVLAGNDAPAALAYLTRTYGAANVDAFFRTFTYAIDDSLRYATLHGIRLPAEPVPNGRVLARRLFAAGTLPNGQYDVGYMLERLVSHPIHMWVMWDIDKQPELGKKTDETFHIMLTDAITSWPLINGFARFVSVALIALGGVCGLGGPVAARTSVVVDDGETGKALLGRFDFVGKWQLVRGKRDGRTNGTSTRSTRTGDVAVLGFSGTRVRIFGVLGPSGGRAGVSLDGASTGGTPIDFYAPRIQTHALIYESPILPPGIHTVTLVVWGTRDERGRFYYVNIDGAEIDTDSAQGR